MKGKGSISSSIPIKPTDQSLGKRGDGSEDRYENGEIKQELTDAGEPPSAAKSVGTAPAQPTGKVKAEPRKVVLQDIPPSDPRYHQGLRVAIRDPIADSEIGAFIDRPAASTYMGIYNMFESD